MTSQSLRLDHIKEICLYIKDLDLSESFYHGLLGLEVIAKADNRHIFFRIGNQVLLCFIAETTKLETRFPPHHASGKQHMAFGVPAEDYMPWKQKITDLNIPITCEYQWREGLESFYFDDPDGNVLEIVPNNLWDN